MKVAVSYLKSNDKKDCIKKIDNSMADFIHVDLCDGKYVKEKNFTVSETENLLKNSITKLDVHFMCNEPKKYVDDFSLLDIETITIHPDACKDVEDTISYIQNMGIKCGIAINPSEKVKKFESLYPLVDRVLIMSVIPGKGGQKFIEKVLPKIDEINELKNKYHFETSVDGGINAETINLLKDKGINVIVSGSFITDSKDYNESIKLLK